MKIDRSGLFITDVEEMKHRKRCLMATCFCFIRIFFTTIQAQQKYPSARVLQVIENKYES